MKQTFLSSNLLLSQKVRWIGKLRKMIIVFLTNLNSQRPGKGKFMRLNNSHFLKYVAVKNYKKQRNLKLARRIYFTCTGQE